MSNLKEYLSLIDESFNGRIENADIRIMESTCDKQSEFLDKFAIYIKIKNNTIENIKGGCGPCTPSAYIAINVLCKILYNKNIKDIINNTDSIKTEFEKFLPLNEFDFLLHYDRIMFMISNKIKEYIKE